MDPVKEFRYEEVAGKFFPIISVAIESNGKGILTRAYVDSGASFSIFDSQVAEYLDIDFRKGEKVFPRGIGGHICAYLNPVTIYIEDIGIPCKVLFSDELVVKFNLLGRAGFFDRFKVCFDDKEEILHLYER
ncbi:MAG: hypothetical protein ACE5PM_09575 [Candidatus Hydrothermarchaeales archaeon]